MRDLILALAVQGKLVRQESNDEAADVLLQKLEATRQQLIGAGRIKRAKPVERVGDADGPFPLPQSWQWIRLGSALEMINGRAFKPSDWLSTGLPIVRIQNLNNEAAAFNYCDPAKVEQRHAIDSGEFLISWSGTPGTSFGAFIWRRGPAALNQHIFKCELIADVFSPEFLRLAINSQLNVLISRAQGGVGLQHVTKGTLESLVLVLPPKQEQARIVARFDELMRLCDALEAQGRLEAGQHARLLGALLGTLTDSSTPEELAANWQRVADHFDLLLDRPEAVDALEQTILRLAVRGLLVQQDPNDEPADDFLQRLREERLRLRTERRGKSDVRCSPIESGLYEVPSGWTWTTIDELAEVGTGTTPSRDNAAFFTGGTIPWVTSGETGQPFIRTTSQHVTEAALASTSLTLYPVGTLIVAMYGQGKTRGQVSELCLEATTNQACAAIVLMEKSASHRDFVKLVFEKSYDEIRELSAGGAQPNLNVGKVKASLIPLPPLAEQARIAAKVAGLRRLCAELRQRLAAIQTTQSHLADALVDEVA